MNLQSENARKLAIAVCALAFVNAIDYGRSSVVSVLSYIYSIHHSVQGFGGLPSPVAFILYSISSFGLLVVCLSIGWFLIRIIPDWGASSFGDYSAAPPGLVKLIGWLLIVVYLLSLCTFLPYLASQSHAILTERKMPMGLNTYPYQADLMLVSWMLGAVKRIIVVAVGTLLVLASRGQLNRSAIEVQPALM